MSKVKRSELERYMTDYPDSPLAEPACLALAVVDAVDAYLYKPSPSKMRELCDRLFEYENIVEDDRETAP